MRICLITTTYPPKQGGLETHVSVLAEGLAATGHAVSAITNRSSRAEPALSVVNGVEVFRTSKLLTDINDPDKIPWEEALFGLLEDFEGFLRSRSFDLFHTHTQAALLLSGLAGLHQCAPLVASFHETQPEIEPRGGERSRFVLGRTPYDLVLAGSRFLAEQAASLGANPSRVRLVYFGLPSFGQSLPHKEARRALLARAGVPEDGPLVTLVGRFKPRKGQHRLLEAFRRLPRPADVRGLLVGSCNSASRAYLNGLQTFVAEHGLTDRVTIVEGCPDDVRDLAWDATTVATQPSAVEGFGLSLVEAMARGRPVVAADVPGIREVITHGEHGVLVNTENAQEYAEALMELLERPDLQAAYGRAGASRAGSLFGAERMVRETLAVYEEAAALRGSKKNRGAAQ